MKPSEKKSEEEKEPIKLSEAELTDEDLDAASAGAGYFKWIDDNFGGRP